MLLLRNLIICILLTTSNVFCFAQREANNWYFGDKAGLTFNTGKPTILSGSQLLSTEGTALMSTSTGKLLFYTEGENVWDSTNNITPNGTKLYSTSGVTQSSIIVPWPDSVGQYLIFTVDINAGKHGLCYSEFNMSLNSGKGDIVFSKKNIQLVTPVSEKVTAVKHFNGHDYWVATHKYNSDTIYVYLVNHNGVNMKPVKTATGLSLSGYTTTYMYGYMRFSPDGKKIAFVNSDLGTSVIADFDNKTGKISNIWTFTNASYGMEFSAGSKYLYTHGYAGIYQWDAKAPTKDSFVNSKILVDSTERYTFALGPDGKIYFINNAINARYLGIIYSPDSLGKACRVRQNQIYLGGRPLYRGLPNFICSWFKKREINFSRNCIFDTTTLSYSLEFKLDSVKWIFGDNSSGARNFSISMGKAFHIYKSEGLYTVTLIYYFGGVSDTLKQSVVIKKPPKPFLGNDTAMCNQLFFKLSPKVNYLKYNWSNAGKGKDIQVFKKGIFWVTVWDSSGCIGADTIQIFNPSVQTAFLVNDSDQCLKGNSFHFTDRSLFKDDSFKKSQWLFSDGSGSTDSLASKSFSKSGVYSIKLITESLAGCRDSLVQNVKVFKQTNIDFSINKAIQCFNVQSFDFNNASYNTDSLVYSWDLGDLNTTQKNFISKKYTKTGDYVVSLVTLSDKGCSDTLKKSISVLSSPKADFNWGVTCSKTPTLFNFTGTLSPYPVITSWLWKFPKDSSQLINPSVLLNQVGFNKVSLTLLSNNGCQDQITKEVDVKPQATTDFDADDVCEDTLARFINKTQIPSGTVNYLWYFGDGKSSNLENPDHQYQINGITKTFNVKLAANAPSGCSDSITKAITVNALPKSVFTFSASGQTVNFTATESNAVSYKWDFGDGGSSISTKRTQSYTYSKFPSGKYKVCLTTTNLAGCSSDSCLEVAISASINSIQQAQIKIYPNPNNGKFVIEIPMFSENSIIEIFDYQGKSIHQQTDVKSLTEINMNLAKGVYLVKVTINDKINVQRVLVRSVR